MKKITVVSIVAVLLFIIVVIALKSDPCTFQPATVSSKC